MLTVFPGVGEAPLHSRYRNLYRPHSKTMLNINNQLLANAKTLAAQQQTGLTGLIEEGLHLPLFERRGGLPAGVDPLNNTAMPAAPWF